MKRCSYPWVVAISILGCLLLPMRGLCQVAPDQCSSPKTTSIGQAGGTVDSVAATAGRYAQAYEIYLCRAFFAGGANDLNSFDPVNNLVSTPDPFINANRAAIRDESAQTIKDDLLGKAKSAASAEVQSGFNAAAQAVSLNGAVNQTGANAQSGAATNLVAKPTTTDLISIAAESGAFTDTTNGSTLTLDANADGIRRYFMQTTLFNPVKADLLRHLTLKGTFNISQAATTNATASTAANPSTPSISSVLIPVNNNLTFNSFTAGYSLYRHYDPRSKDFADKWAKALAAQKAATQPSLAALHQAYEDLTKGTDPAPLTNATDGIRTTWIAASKADISANDFAAFAKDFEIYAEGYEKAWNTVLGLGDSGLAQKLLAVVKTKLALEDTLHQVLDDARGSFLTAQYTYTKQSTTPATNDVTLVYAYNWKDGFQMTANGFGSWYASTPAGSSYGRFRAYQLSAEVDKTIGPSTAPKATLSVAGYGQNQSDKTVLNITAGNLAPGTNIALPDNAQVLLGTTGWTAVAQAKVVVNIPKASGLTIPIAVKWSNQTSLLADTDWRGQLGISYDLTALSSLLMGGSKK